MSMRQDILEAMAGIALVLDRELHVVAGGWRNWRAFWQANGGVGPAPAMLGCDLTAGFSAGVVRTGFRAALMAIAADERGPLRLPFRCDAPGLRRDMLLSVTRCGPSHLLYHALTLSETALPVPFRATPAPCRCAVCGRVAPEEREPADAAGPDRVHLDWVEPALHLPVPPLTDEMCPRCTMRLMAQAA